MSKPVRPRFVDDRQVVGGRVDSEAIRARMRRLRSELNGEVEAAKAEANQMLDWRSYVASKPLTCLGVAALAGYLLAPKANRVVRLTDKQVTRLVKQGGVNVSASASTPTSKGSAITSAMLAAGAVVARTALTNWVSGLVAAKATAAEMQQEQRPPEGPDLGFPDPSPAAGPANPDDPAPRW